MSSRFRFDLKVILGWFCVFGSAFFFYLATIIVKYSSINGIDIDPAFFVFSRFLIGFITVLIVMMVTRKKIKIIKKRYLIGRTVFNCIAVYCFFMGVDLTSVSQANILNMTYPLFIAVFSWIFLKEQRDGFAVLMVILAFVGVWLILAPATSDNMGFDMNSLWALASGVTAAIAIIYLNLSRQVHDTQTILFVMFGLGTVIMYIAFMDKIHWPQSIQLPYLFFCSLFAIIGQYLLTIGFKYVTAVEGGIISSTRILLAALLGPFVVMDPYLSLSGWVGALLIFSGNVYLTMRKMHQSG